MSGPPSPSSAAPGPPTSGDQVAAHRFVLRRMQSALVRRETVPGGVSGADPLRAHTRAVLAGIVLAALVLGGVAVWGRTAAKQADWRSAAVVVGDSSGALAVVLDGPKRLLPVPNLASARLVLATLGGSGPADPVEVPDAALAAAPHQGPVGIPDAPALPPPGTPAPAVWSVCDTSSPGPVRGQEWVRPSVSTTVVTGERPPGRPLAPGEKLLLRDRFGGTWLVHDGLRARIELSDPVLIAFGLGGQLPRPVTTSVLDAVPETTPIAVPLLPGRGAPAPVDLAGEPVGGVVRVLASGEVFYVVEQGGVQQVSPAVARLVRLSDPDPRRAVAPVPVIPLGALAAAGDARAIPVGAYPDLGPRTVTAADASTQCLSSGGGDTTPTVTVLAGPPPTATRPVVLAGADASGDRVDAVALPGTGLVVRSVPPGRPDLPGPSVVVSASGTASGVPDPRAAAALGLGPGAPPAPASIVRLLPAGPALTVDAALRPLDGSP